MTSSSHSAKKTDTDAASPETRRKRRIAMIALTAVFSFIALIWLIYWLVWGQFYVYTDDAYVDGNIVALMPQIAGTVVAINTDDTYLVQKGQVLIKLDPADANIAFKRAQAELAQTVRQVNKAFDTTEQMQALVLLRAANLKKAQLDHKRRRGLVDQQAISREEWQHYETAFDDAKAQYAYSLHQLSAARTFVDNVSLYHHPQVERAKASFRKAYLNLQRTTIVAPLTGYVTKRNVQVGQQVAMNTPMLAIVPLNKVWVEANYKESQLSDLRIGQPVTLYADAHPDITYHGKVMGLAAGTGAAFSLLPPQNATGNWIKIVQRLPVRIQLDAEELRQYPLQIGLSMRVTTDIHDTSGHRLANEAAAQAVYATDVYVNQLAEVNKLIDTILKENAQDRMLQMNAMKPTGTKKSHD